MIPVIVLLAIFLFFAYVNPFGQGNAYRPAALKIETLKNLKVLSDEAGKKVFGAGRLEKRGGLYVLKLKGSAYEMGYQHGQLLREEIRNGAMPYQAYPVYTHSPYYPLPGVKKWFLTRYFDWVIYHPLMKNAPLRFLEEIKGLADGSGLKFDLVLRGNLLSEFRMITTPQLKKTMLKRLQTDGECSCFAAFDDMTRDGNLIVGRNTDYSGAGLWDQTQTVFFYEPDDGYRYVNVGAAGLIKCNTCMNEHGLCLGGHFMYSTDVTSNGAGFTALEHAIMLRASTVEEAHALVQSSKRAGAFAYLLAGGREKNAAVVEATASRVGLRYAEGGFICETNFMTTDETRPVDSILELGIAKNAISRFRRLEELIRENAGSITPQRAAQFMGDHKDMCSGDIRPFGNVIATLGNLTSTVFLPVEHVFWVADGLAPVCNNIFLGFNFFKEFENQPYLVTPEILEPNEYVKTVSYEALREFYPLRVDAVLPPFRREDLLERVSEVVKMTPGEVVYRLLVIKLLLHQGKATDAAEQLKLMVDYALSPSEQAQVMLLLGFTYDLNGDREVARRCYQDILQKTQSPRQDVLTAVNPFILADANRFLQRAFTNQHIACVEISLDMGSSYDR